VIRIDFLKEWERKQYNCDICLKRSADVIVSYKNREKLTLVLCRMCAKNYVERLIYGQDPVEAWEDLRKGDRNGC